MPVPNYQNPLRRKLKSADPVYGLWVTLESATVTEIAAEMGIDWICVDLEHGSLDYKDVVAHCRAAKGTGMAVLVRVPGITTEAVKRSFDLGADGVVLPLVRTAADLEDGFRFGRYPMRGERGIGAERATRWGLRLEEYLSTADEETMIIPLIETASASREIESILGVNGLEAVFLGPADLSSSFGHLGQWEGPGVAEDVLRIRAHAAARGIAAGIFAMDTDDVARRIEEGFRMVALGSDVGLMIRQMKPLLLNLKGAEFRSRG